MKINKQQVRRLKRDLAQNKLTQDELAKKYGVSRSTVSDIATGRIHKDVPGELPRKKAGGQANRILTPDEHISELQAENIHLREERDLALRGLKMARKTHGLFRAMADELQSFAQPFAPAPVQYKAHKGKIKESLVLHLSDGHHDQIVVPEECGGLERYNFSISCRRAERLVDTVLEYSQDTLAPKYDFETLYILAYGDHTSGEIHQAVQRSVCRNMFKNCWLIGQLHARMIFDFAPHFKRVVVIYIPGNHGRRSIEKDHHGAHDNWDYLVAKVAEQICSELPNVEFLIPNSFSVNLEIEGIGFSCQHGDDVKGQQGIPFYGLVRQQKNIIGLSAMQNGPRIRYLCMGHHHVSGDLSDFDGELLLNGAWLGTDAYAYDRFKGYREPKQLLHGVHPVNGVTWRLPVLLRTKKEHEGPTRYKIST